MTGARFHWASISSTRLSRYPGRSNTKSTEPASSSSTPSSDSQPSASSPIGPDAVIHAKPLGDSPADPRIQNRGAGNGGEGDAGGDGNDSSPSSQLPTSLDILWSPEPHAGGPSTSNLQNLDLPPPEIFEDVLDNLRVTLNPQTQHHATSTPQDGITSSTVEPTLALYCPIEGGYHVLDETVKELARGIEADVVVLDCAQLAAGSAGQFGSAANVLQLPDHPLHFQVSPRPLPPVRRPSWFHIFSSDRAVKPPVGSQGISRTPQPELKSFFDCVINVASLPPPPAADACIEGSTPSTSSPRKPRIVYIRDFNTLAASARYWYPALLQSVRQRRAGLTTNAASPVLNPTTIIFGVTPPVVPRIRPYREGSGIAGLQSAPVNKRPASSSERERAGGTGKSESGSVVGESEWGEDESSDHAREKRLKERIKKWEDDERTFLAGELPTIQSISSPPDDPPPLPGSSPSPSPSPSTSSVDETDVPVSKNNFFRSSVVVPSRRSVENEKISRTNRRREINELAVRMALSSVGGTLPPLEVPALEGALGHPEADGIQPAERSDLVRMWDALGRVVVVWNIVEQVADRALGSVSGTQQGHELQSQRQSRSREVPRLTLDPMAVPWSAVARAFLTKASAGAMRKHWASQTVNVKGSSADDNDGEEKEVDEVIERVKQNTDLNKHEHRLLKCIVDSRTLTSSFEQVHLPPHTIDSVRSIVSLPLIHPHAFQYGILKAHRMAGCLLFGPPGTGKTLVVRALAKESQCRMLAVSPADVMDMYLGEAEKLVKAVFSLARRLSPCVVFIDEIDSLFGARPSSSDTGCARAYRGVITEFMTEMDGLRSNSQDRVIVIGATNRPFDLDDAVLRRLPRRLLVDLPGERERKEILRILLKEENVAEGVDLGDIAKRTGDFSGSDLKHLCVAAALDAVKEGVTLPWGATETSVEGIHANTPCTTDVSAGEAGARVSVVNDNVGARSTTTDSGSDSATESHSSSASRSTDATSEALSEHPRRVISLSNFEKALKEITPSSSESLGTLTKLRKWNDEFGEGKKEKRRPVWGKGSFGFVERGDGQGGITVRCKNDRPG